MSVYGLVLESTHTAHRVFDALSADFGEDNVYWCLGNNEAFFLVATSATDASERIADSAGISNEQLGIGFHLSSGYCGTADIALWSWLEEKHKRPWLDQHFG